MLQNDFFVQRWLSMLDSQFIFYACILQRALLGLRGQRLAEIIFKAGIKTAKTVTSF